MENGEYSRSSEITEEQNYNLIDGRKNNMPSPKKPQERKSVLAKLYKKQAEIAAKDGKKEYLVLRRMLLFPAVISM